jgi:hypothetical protein
VRYSGRVVVLLGAVSASCDGAVVSLGDAQPPLYHFGTPHPLTELNTIYANENPTLTGDLMELWFNSNRGTTGGDVWVARRESAQAPFTTVERVDAVSSDLFETSAAISLDGLSIYFGSDRAGGLGDIDIWRATRATRASPWSAPENLLALNSAAKDLPRPLGQHGLVMPLASQRDNIILYQTFLSARPSAGGAFGPPVSIPELAFSDRTTVDAFLSDDGLTLFYASAPLNAKLDLYVAWRKTTAQPFSVAVPLDDLNSADDERDPWLSPDGTVFYFTSDRMGGVLQIYEAPASRGPSAGR